MSIGPERQIPSSADEAPDEQSTENVLEVLNRYDEDLRQSGMLPGEDTEHFPLRNIGDAYVDPRDLEVEQAEEQLKEEFEEYTADIRSALTTVGLSDPSSVTAANLKEVDIEILRQLDPLNAESLFFDVARKVHQRLGLYEPVSWKRLLEQAQMAPLKPAEERIVPGLHFKHRRRQYLDLDSLRLEQRISDLNFLIELGINPQELGLMLRDESSLEMKQNINRLAYYFQEEPILVGFVSSLKEKGPMSVEEAIRMSQIVLRYELDGMNSQKEQQELYKSDERWDSIDHEVYKRIARRMKHSFSISNKVLESMKLKTVEDFIESLADN